jgi:thiol-disulfide isomerase/thioredoxin
MSISPRVLLATLVVVLAGAGGYFAYKLDNRTHDTVRAVDPSEPAFKPPLDPESLHAELDPYAGRTVPERLPDFTLPDLQGRPQKLTNWSDRPVMVNFWATWCEPCRREIPLLIKLRKQHAAERLEIVGIAVDFRDAVLKYASDIGIDYPVLIGEQEALDAIDAFGMQPVFPFSVFADRQGRIVAIRVGELREDEAEFILAQVKSIDSGQANLGEAKQKISEKLRDLAVQRATTAAR